MIDIAAADVAPTAAQTAAPIQLEVAAAPKKKVAGARRIARLYAVMAVYTLEHGRSDVTQVSHDFLQHIIDSDMFEQTLVSPDVKLFQRLVNSTLTRVGVLDAALKHVLNHEQKRDFGRLDAALRALLRVAANELLHEAGSTPPAIIINEYIEVARAFFGDEQRIPAMVNGVQDALLKMNS